MYLEISNHQGLLTKSFGNWLIKELHNNFFINLNEAKLKNWDTYFEKSDEYKSIYKKKIITKEILIIGIKNLICKEAATKLIIQINPNLFVPGLDRIRIDQLCRVINYGTITTQGYPIFTDLFIEVSDNINQYIDKYINGL